MLRAFAGQDNYASYHAAKSYTRKLAQQLGWEIVSLDAEELKDPSRLWQLLLSQSLLSEGNVVLLKRVSQNSNLARELAENWDKIESKPLVIWEDGDLDQRNKLNKQLVAAKRVEQFNPLEESSLIDWLQSKALDLEQKVSKAVLQVLISEVGADRWRLESELTKLCLLAKQRNTEPSIDLWQEIKSVDIEGNIWQFLDSLALGERQKAIHQFKILMAAEDMGQYLISMLARELDLLAGVISVQQENGSLEELKLKPFVLKQAVRKAKRFTLPKLQKLTYALWRLDTSIKQGKVDEYTGLGLYILSW